jgi:hypothetical protein
MTDKEKIVELFNSKVKGRAPDLSSFNVGHDGGAGHWLERAMGIKANASNTPDLYGYEMKNNTSSKTTFGDWSANYYVYQDINYQLQDRDDFLQIFGRPNPDKGMRYSWSGQPCPKIKVFNLYGQILLVDSAKNIHAKYFYSKDTRSDKSKIVPVDLQQDDLTIARWDRKSIQGKLERKFNQKGWFKCLQNNGGVYTSIVFGDPINYDNWIKLVQSGDVFFDSGMYEGNSRPYSQWRANNSLWDQLVTSRY